MNSKLKRRCDVLRSSILFYVKSVKLFVVKDIVLLVVIEQFT